MNAAFLFCLLAVANAAKLGQVADDTAEFEYPQENNPCDFSPCLNGGTCFSEEGNFWCECPENFRGYFCDLSASESDPCANSPCVNGVCRSEENFYWCDCSEGWSGFTCDVEYDNSACAGNPCQNGGSCVVLAPFSADAEVAEEEVSEDVSDADVTEVDEEVAADAAEVDAETEFEAEEAAAEAEEVEEEAESNPPAFFCVCPDGFTGGFCEIPVSDEEVFFPAEEEPL